ncbi:hypothetical protein PHAVU_008G231800 [Phaseolus vulgaris]|uniref:Uncharacterized protein n=1 Tax=Phaseolus vulgaris TaxID=3885 RepID=V7B7R3_PHAVU|nr:hypothetical protein PHAVU_008G231800g [Phaseolus vulgaris]XP_007141860.1 hypothetical protein PHAVU_008G231800g [Phaseolus vulgaris]ESW13853.1 hypothetical protein PHAVU_008G231800g [Phaseolus vulgaris]ESW13854.1 hypothetical protein PHAVU_008G231800g [Phaseolus vulgaris]
MIAELEATVCLSTKKRSRLTAMQGCEGGSEVLCGEMRAQGTVSATMESLIATIMELRAMQKREESERKGEKK